MIRRLSIMHFRKIHLVIGVCVIFNLSINAQDNLPNPSVPAASSSNSVQNLQVSSDLYNGKVNVTIPFYNYDFEGMSFPLSLSYTGGNGIKPDEISGWVGYGWNLQAGGYVRRKVRGKPDEFRDFQTKITSYYCTSKWPDKQTQLTADRSYFTNRNLLSASNWSTAGYANSLYLGQNFSGITTTPCADIETYNHTPNYDLVPDEFSFSIGAISGKFYLNYLNKWIVISNDGKNYDLDLSIGEQEMIRYSSPNFPDVTYKSPNVIKGFTLKSTDGIKYYFGNSDPSATVENNYWDHSRSSQVNPGGNPAYARPYDRRSPADNLLDLSPHTWHLTKIENLKTGSMIVFNLKKAGLSLYKSRQMWGYNNKFFYTNTTITVPDINDPSSGSIFTKSAMVNVLSRSWLVSEILFPNNVKIEFLSSLSSQALSSEDIVNLDNAGYFDNEEIWYSPEKHTSLYKLDRIKVFYQNQLKKEFCFVYQNSFSNRLQLKELQEISNNVASSVYKFEYNNDNTAFGKLPLHASAITDHWGYYNNKNFFAGVSGPYTNYSSLLTYSQYRVADGNYSKAEILNKITYPTGGSVEFEYEPHSYSKIRNKGDFVIVAGINNSEAGGLRISKIRYLSASGVISSEKSYDYNIPGSMLSSGVLIGAIPVYLSGDASFYRFRAYGFNPNYYEGNNVTYTYATEKEAGNGRSQYEYTNYDNGFNDAVPNGTSFGAIKDDWYALKAFKRGKVKKSKIYGETSTTPVSETIFHYEHENSETDKDELRSLYLTPENPNEYVAISERLYQDRLISKEEKTYSLANTIYNTIIHLYDDYGNLKETSLLDSKGKQIKKYFKYSYEFGIAGSVVDNASLGIINANNLGIKSALIESYVTQKEQGSNDEYLTSASLLTYKPDRAYVDEQYNLELASPLPLDDYTQATISNGYFIFDPRFGNYQMKNIRYDSKGNVLEYVDRKGVVTAVLWGYNSSYPVLKAEGKDYTSLLSYVDLNKINNPSSDVTLRNELNKIRTGFNSLEAIVKSYTYNPLVGLTSETDGTGKTTYYEYDNFGRLVLVRGFDKQIIKKYCYNNWQQIENCDVYGTIKYVSSISLPYTLKLTNLSTSVVSTFGVYGGSSLQTQTIQNIIPGKYNVELTPQYNPPTTYKFSCEGQDQIGNNFILSNYLLGSELFFELGRDPNATCSINMNTGFTNVTSGINNGTPVTLYLVFFPSSQMDAGNTYVVGQINGACTPTETRQLTYTTDSRTWSITIQPSGQVSVQFTGPSVTANSTVQLTSLSYSP